MKIAMKSTLKISLLAIVMLPLVWAFNSRADGHGSCQEVSITEMNWASSQVVTGVAKFIMENGYGCEVTVVPSSTVPALTSLAENGKPDIVTELWTNGATVYFELLKEGKVQEAAQVLTDGGVEGWWIPSYLAEEHPELRTIDGVMANTQLVGNRFHNCPSGWACQIVNNNYIKAFEMVGKIEVFDHGSGETLAASLAAAYENKEPWFGYYWAPTSLLGRYPMVSVDMGPADVERHTCARDAECENPQRSSYPPGEVVTAVTTDFAEKNPQVYDLMSKVSFSNQIMGELLAWKEDNQASIEETTVYFLTSYPDVWKTWLNDSASKRLAALL